jgi:biopolymer transport protein ExbD
MVRNSITLVPLVGVLIALMIVTIAPLLTSVEMQVPRRLDFEGHGIQADVATIRVYLHADDAVTLEVNGDRALVLARSMLARVRSAVEYHHVDAIYVRPDEGVSWQQIVETTASLRRATDLPVALDTAEPPTAQSLEM